MQTVFLLGGKRFYQSKESLHTLPPIQQREYDKSGDHGLLDKFDKKVIENYIFQARHLRCFV